MIPAIRQKKILEMLSTNEIVSTDYLMEQLNISVSTLRRDLVKLESEHKLVLLHGGGVQLPSNTNELNISIKFNLNKEAKEAIAQKAASLVEDGDVIFLDPSSTTFFMIPYLAGKDITVLSNGISHISRLISLDIPCIMIGGTIKKTTYSCIGSIAENLISSFNFNKCFLGANGFSINAGITNHDINERTIKLSALNNSSETYFLIDHTKYGVITLVKIADLDQYPILTDFIPEELSEYKNIQLC